MVGGRYKSLSRRCAKKYPVAGLAGLAGPQRDREKSLLNEAHPLHIAALSIGDN